MYLKVDEYIQQEYKGNVYISFTICGERVRLKLDPAIADSIVVIDDIVEQKSEELTDDDIFAMLESGIKKESNNIDKKVKDAKDNVVYSTTNIGEAGDYERLMSNATSASFVSRFPLHLLMKAKTDPRFPQSQGFRLTVAMEAMKRTGTNGNFIPGSWRDFVYGNDEAIDEIERQGIDVARPQTQKFQTGAMPDTKINFGESPRPPIFSDET